MRELVLHPPIRLSEVFSVADLADMVAIGLGLPAETFRDAGRYGYSSPSFS